MKWSKNGENNENSNSIGKTKRFSNEAFIEYHFRSIEYIKIGRHSHHYMIETEKCSFERMCIDYYFYYSRADSNSKCTQIIQANIVK